MCNSKYLEQLLSFKTDCPGHSRSSKRTGTRKSNSCSVIDRSTLFFLHVIVWVKLSSLHNTALLQDSRGPYRGGEHPHSLGWRKRGTQRLTTLPPVLHQLHWQETKGRIQTCSHFLLISSAITWPCRQTKVCPELQPWLELQKANQHAKGKVSARLGAPLPPLTTTEPCHQVWQVHHRSFSPTNLWSGPHRLCILCKPTDCLKCLFFWGLFLQPTNS